MEEKRSDIACNGIPCNKITWKLVLSELGVLFLAAAGAFGVSYLRGNALDTAVRDCCMTVLGTAVLGFHFRQEFLGDRLDYNNVECPQRFWMMFLFSLAISFACVFLPANGWPYMALFVLLSFFSNLSIGMLGASVLLMLSVLLSGAGTEIFMLYFVSGTFAAILFRNLERDFKVGIPLVLSLLCLMLCETADVVLMANARPSLELYVIPMANLVVSGLFLIGILKFFFGRVIYQYRDRYLGLNDTENPMLVEYRQNARSEYLCSIHTAYFCERIAARLQLDVDALKCAAYYHRMGEQILPLMKEKRFPPPAQDILREYVDHKNSYVGSKEAVVLLCADAVVSTVMYIMAKKPEAQPDYDQVIDAVFKRFWDGGVFGHSDISLRDLKVMYGIFKEEKLYYDFLR